MLNHHLNYSTTGENHRNPCKLCEVTAYSTCSICGLNMYLMSIRGQTSVTNLSFDYRNNVVFGISWCNSNITTIKIYNCTYPTQANKKSNTRYVKYIKDDMSNI